MPTERQLLAHLDGPDLERLVVVSSDLEWLQGLPRDRLPSHTEVRLAASVLRRLLFDNGGQLLKVWRLFDPDGVAPLTVEARDLGALIAQWPAEWLVYAWAGGAGYELAANYDAFVFYAVPKAVHEAHASLDDFLNAQGMPRQPELARFKIMPWLNSVAVAIRTDAGQVQISRKTVVDYIANRKGGVHFDPSHRFDLGGRPKMSPRNIQYHLLEHGLIRVGHLSGPEFEVASVAQVIADAEWATELVRAGAEAAPADYHGNPSELKYWTGAVQADGTGWATSTWHPGPARRDGLPSLLQAAVVQSGSGERAARQVDQ